MMYGLVGLYALYFIFVGASGHANNFFDNIRKDVKGFAAWVIAIILLKALASNDKIRPFIMPFIALAVLTFVLKNYDSIVSQLNSITGLSLPLSKGETK